jgi:hypothetical protein
MAGVGGTKPAMLQSVCPLPYLMLLQWQGVVGVVRPSPALPMVAPITEISSSSCPLS